MRRGPEELGQDSPPAAEGSEEAVSYAPVEPVHEELEDEPALGAAPVEHYATEPEEPLGLDEHSDYGPEPAEPPASTPMPHPAGTLEPEPAAIPPADSGHAGPETVEYDVATEHDDKAGDDMLEETPEFLQDTPDHDRLWFKQRPPRDFDFDS